MSLKIHEMCKMWPMRSPESLAALREDVREQGFLEPAMLWTDPGGTEWIIDGRSRSLIANELADEGADKANNGKKIELEYEEFKGTLSEAITFVKGKNGPARRHMTPSQLAATAYEHERLAEKYAKKDGVDFVRPEGSGEYGDYISKLWGFNRQYWYDIAKIAEYPAMFEQVKNGQIAITEAMRQIRGSDDKKGGDGSNGDEGGPLEIVVTDALRNPILEKPFVAIFDKRPVFKSARQGIINAMNECVSLANGPGGKFLSGDIDELKTALTNCARMIDAATPFAICPACEGEGKDKKGERCNICNGKKYVSKSAWKHVPAELKTAGGVED